jgi:hypothetical protein
MDHLLSEGDMPVPISAVKSNCDALVNDGQLIQVVVHVLAIPLHPVSDALGLDGEGAGRQPIVDGMGAHLIPPGTIADGWADRFFFFGWRYAISWGAVNAMVGGSGPGTLVIVLSHVFKTTTDRDERRPWEFWMPLAPTSALIQRP